MTPTTLTTSQRIRADLDHPVIDCDGHVLEVSAVLADYIAEEGGAAAADRYRGLAVVNTIVHQAGIDMPVEQRRGRWIQRAQWWNYPARNTLDRATAMLPALMAERLDAMGIDLAILYPTEGLLLQTIDDDDFLTMVCRAFNRYYMDLLRDHADRMLPVALIPMHSPDVAVEALDHAVSELGYRAVVLQQWVSRPIPAIDREETSIASFNQRPDWFGLDSAFDYDPVWAKCVDLGVAATFHGIGSGAAGTTRGSISNHLFNRLGFLGWQHRRSATAMFLGGVTHRFPTLNFAWLEGGVTWATSLLADLAGVWDKRNVEALEHLNPANIDVALLTSLVDKYGDGSTQAHADDIRAYFSRQLPNPSECNEFKAAGAHSLAEVLERFCPRFYFGCEGDDTLYASAYDTDRLPAGSAVHAIYGSDIGHWDVPDMDESLEEAFEPVAAGIVTPAQFKEFVFTNPVGLHAGMNPRFFDGTRVEQAVRQHREAAR